MIAGAADEQLSMLSTDEYPRSWYKDFYRSIILMSLEAASVVLMGLRAAQICEFEVFWPVCQCGVSQCTNPLIAC